MQATFYLKDHQRILWKRFQEVAEREHGRGGVNKILIPFIEKYVAAHGHGNPQTILDYAGQPRTLPKWKTCRNSLKEQHQGEVYCRLVKRSISTQTWVSTIRCHSCEHYE